MFTVRLFCLVFLVFISACSSSQKKLDLGEGSVAIKNKCSTDSYLNRYADYTCAALELENSNDYVESENPIHNLKGIALKRHQRLLVVDEKIFGASVRQRDQEIVCTRRLKVILNPGVGREASYQVGWITFVPKCFQFFKIKNTAETQQKTDLLSQK